MGDLIDINEARLNLINKNIGVQHSEALPQSPPQRVLERIKQILAEEHCYLRIYATLEPLGVDTCRTVAHLDIKYTEPKETG